MPTNQIHAPRHLLVLALMLGACAGAATAGELEPVAPPAPTMKTLVDVEPRIALRNDFDNLIPLIISDPGSYYLAEDVFAFGNQNGIRINASNVTLDLNGFTVYGNLEVGSNVGIFVNPANDNVWIKNGTVQNFSQHGISAQGFGNRVTDVQVISNLLIGIQLGDRAHVRNCISRGNGGDGITALGGSTILESEASDNDGRGIFVTGTVVSDCSAYANGTDGIQAINGSAVRGCSSVLNGQDGIDAPNALIQGNSAISNGGLQIVNHASSVLVDNNT